MPSTSVLPDAKSAATATERFGHSTHKKLTALKNFTADKYKHISTQKARYILMDKYDGIQLDSGAMSKRSSMMAQSRSSEFLLRDKQQSKGQPLTFENFSSKNAIVTTDAAAPSVHMPPESIQNSAVLPARHHRSSFPSHNRQHTMSLYQQHSLGLSEFWRRISFLSVSKYLTQLYTHKYNCNI